MFESIPSADELLEFITKIIEHPYGWIAAIIILFGLWNQGQFDRLIHAMASRNTREVDLYKRLMDDMDDKDSNIYSLYRKKYESACFRLATGIRAEGKRLMNLVFLHELVSHELSWKSVKAAEKFIEFPGEGIKASIRHERLGEFLFRCYCYAAGFCMILLSGLLLIATSFGAEGWLQHGVGFFTALALAGFSLVPFSEQWRYSAAKKLRKVLANMANSDCREESPACQASAAAQKESASRGSHEKVVGA